MPGGLSSGEGLIWAVRDPEDQGQGETGIDTQGSSDRTVEEILAKKTAKTRDYD
jgi:hypothetical protein